MSIKGSTEEKKEVPLQSLHIWKAFGFFEKLDSLFGVFYSSLQVGLVLKIMKLGVIQKMKYSI